jgi:UDP-glucose 4-epimerase
MQTIVVTGAAGYIGSHTLIELLKQTNHRIVAVDNFSHSSSQAYDRVKQICSRDFEIIELDLCDRPGLWKAFSGFPSIEGIIHFAAFKSVPESMADPIRYYRNNLDSLLNLLEYCGEKQVKNFIFSSSCSVYGNSTALPVTEETPLQPAESPYGHTKQIGEDMLRFFCRSNPWFNAVLLRYFNPVGAHMSGLNGEVPIGKPDNLVPIVTQTASGKNSLTVFGNDYNTRDGYCIRDYIHVTDVADAHLRALEYLFGKRNSKNLSVFNLGTGDGVSVQEVIRSFEKVSGRKLDYKVGGRRAGDVVAVYANNDKARKELGWRTKYSLDDMMLSAWKWQQRLDAEDMKATTSSRKSS